MLSDRGSAPTLIFDEIDTGAGGAVAAAIGQRLQRLSEKIQVLLLRTHPKLHRKRIVIFLFQRLKAMIKGALLQLFIKWKSRSVQKKLLVCWQENRLLRRHERLLKSFLLSYHWDKIKDGQACVHLNSLHD